MTKAGLVAAFSRWSQLRWPTVLRATLRGRRDGRSRAWQSLAISEPQQTTQPRARVSPNSSVTSGQRPGSTASPTHISRPNKPTVRQAIVSRAHRRGGRPRYSRPPLARSSNSPVGPLTERLQSSGKTSTALILALRETFWPLGGCTSASDSRHSSTRPFLTDTWLPHAERRNTTTRITAAHSVAPTMSTGRAGTCCVCAVRLPQSGGEYLLTGTVAVSRPHVSGRFELPSTHSLPGVGISQYTF